MDHVGGVEIPLSLRKLLYIWFRARVRELAHTHASERLDKKAHNSHVWEISINIIGLALLVIGLSIKDIEFMVPVSEFIAQFFASGKAHLDTRSNLLSSAQILIVFSALLSIWALFIAVTARRKEDIIMQGRHKLVARMFMSIAQKVRRPESGIFDEHYNEILIYALNDQLETILSAGENPSDADYKIAHQQIGSILNNEMRVILFSFLPGIEQQSIEAFVRDLLGRKEARAKKRCYFI